MNMNNNQNMNMMNGMNGMMNGMMNNMNIMNNMNMNNQNQDDLPQETEDTIFVTFTFKKNKKQIYIDIGINQTFNEAINILKNKYEWLKNMNNLKYSFNGQILLENKFNMTIKALGINESSDISILD